MRVFLFIMSLFIMTTSLYANIDEEIERIQNAKVEERFKLMNKFKEHLIEMKEVERIKAMEKLFASANNKIKNKKALEEIKKKTLRKNIFLHVEHEMESESLNGGEEDAD